MNKSTVNKSPITTHVLDTATGKPAANVPVTLYQKIDNDWVLITKGITNDDGRILDWLGADTNIGFATYKLTFDLDSYFSQQHTAQVEPAFYPLAEICFRLQDNKHHHIPLLLSPFGYSTYRGS